MYTRKNTNILACACVLEIELKESDHQNYTPPNTHTHVHATQKTGHNNSQKIRIESKWLKFFFFLEIHFFCVDKFNIQNLLKLIQNSTTKHHSMLGNFLCTSLNMARHTRSTQLFTKALMKSNSLTLSTNYCNLVQNSIKNMKYKTSNVSNVSRDVSRHRIRAVSLT